VYAISFAVRVLFSGGMVALGWCPDLWENAMSWWKTALIYIGKKALQIAGEELKKKAAKK
jgi:hypothetical protein